MGLDPKTIKWTLNPEYAEHEWDDKADPVTPDPLYQALIGLANWEDVGIEAATGVGKTFLAAQIMFWFLDCWPIGFDDEGNITDPGAIVVSLASKEKQLKKVLWKEIGRQFPRFQKLHPQARLMDLTIRMMPGDATKELWTAYGTTAQVQKGAESAIALQGIHSPHMLFLMDETTGIHPAILEAIENTCTAPHNLRLVLGNPNSQADVLHKFCQLPTTRHIRASALDHPNVVLEDPSYIEGAVSQTAIDRRLKKYKDSEHPLILSRVHGVSPSTSGLTLFTNKVIKLTKHKLEEPDIIREVRPPSEGQLRIYDEPVASHYGRYVIFADVAGDKAKSGDYHAAVCFDRVEQKISALVHMRGPRKHYIKYLLVMAEHFTFEYGGVIDYERSQDGFEALYKKQHPLLAYEQNAVGGLHLDPRMEKYPNLFYNVNTKHIDRNEKKQPGWNTNRSTRTDMMDALEDWMLELYEHPERLRDELAWKEAKTFSWDGDTGRFEAETGHHDDIMMALSGACVLDQLSRPPRKIPPEKKEKRTGHREPSMEERMMKELEKARQSSNAQKGPGNVSLPSFASIP